MEQPKIYLIIEAISWESQEVKKAFYKKEDAEKYLKDNNLDNFAHSIEEIEIS